MSQINCLITSFIGPQNLFAIDITIQSNNGIFKTGNYTFTMTSIVQTISIRFINNSELNTIHINSFNILSINPNAPIPDGTYNVALTRDSSTDTYNIQNSPYIINTVCFLGNTEIVCLMDDVEVKIPIDKIKIGTKVKTYNNDYVSVRNIFHKKFYNDINNPIKKNKLYKLQSQEPNCPPLFLTGGHSILVDDLTEYETSETLKVWNTCEKICDKYKLLTYINKNANAHYKNAVYSIYNIVLEHTDQDYQYGIYANGFLIETLSIYLYETFMAFRGLN